MKSAHASSLDTPDPGTTARRFSRRCTARSRTCSQRRLDEGEWKPGELIPSEIELATRFQVSQGTVRKAVDELAAENLLVRRQGKGTFVATHHEPRAQFRFLRVVPDDGEPTPPQSRFLECRRVRAPADIARQLRLKHRRSRSSICGDC